MGYLKLEIAMDMALKKSDLKDKFKERIRVFDHLFLRRDIAHTVQDAKNKLQEIYSKCHLFETNIRTDHISTAIDALEDHKYYIECTVGEFIDHEMTEWLSLLLDENDQVLEKMGFPPDHIARMNDFCNLNCYEHFKSRVYEAISEVEQQFKERIDAADLEKFDNLKSSISDNGISYKSLDRIIVHLRQKNNLSYEACLSIINLKTDEVNQLKTLKMEMSVELKNLCQQLASELLPTNCESVYFNKVILSLVQEIRHVQNCLELMDLDNMSQDEWVDYFSNNPCPRMESIIRASQDLLSIENDKKYHDIDEGDDFNDADYYDTSSHSPGL